MGVGPQFSEKKPIKGPHFRKGVFRAQVPEIDQKSDTPLTRVLSPPLATSLFFSSRALEFSALKNLQLSLLASPPFLPAVSSLFEI